ncbi:nicotinamide riboside kinase 1 isoform X1 [Electrophorus electricus]|uniref:nicotinamide riboside kinase 1 isoform X1 n=2 Tax=Electrophorus electricus TaxID=8005 RepID=UPI0015CFB067|nr:nicotinamide riboside kinase 1 isoform X1 [Electrophorus electricus]
MKRFIIGIGGVTNGGKSTLSRSLQGILPNSCIISQDSFFKDDSVVLTDSRGFKQYDTLDALHMDRMMSEICSWQQDPQDFMLPKAKCFTSEGTKVFFLIVEGFLIFNYGPLNMLFDKRYFLQIPYETCKLRRSSRVYMPQDPIGYFDGHVWPMYLKNRKKMEDMVHDIVSSEEIGSIIKKEGEILTMECVKEHHMGLDLVVKCPQKHSVLYYDFKSQKITLNMDYKERVNISINRQKITIVLTDLQLEDSGLYSCIYTRIIDYDVLQEAGDQVFLFVNKSCPKKAVPVSTVIVAMACAVLLLYALAMVVWVGCKVKALSVSGGDTASRISNPVYEDMTSRRVQ